MLPNFSLFRLHNQNDEINGIAALTKENSTSILLEELNRGNIDVIVGDLSHFNQIQLYVENIYRGFYRCLCSKE